MQQVQINIHVVNICQLWKRLFYLIDLQKLGIWAVLWLPNFSNGARVAFGLEAVYGTSSNVVRVCPRFPPVSILPKLLLNIVILFVAYTVGWKQYLLLFDLLLRLRVDVQLIQQLLLLDGELDNRVPVRASSLAPYSDETVLAGDEMLDDLATFAGELDAVGSE